jgi:hypothetical protein
MAARSLQWRPGESPPREFDCLAGAPKKSGSNLASYPLFEEEYCRALITPGYDDTMQRRDNLMKFLGHEACRLQWPLSENAS